MWPTSSNALAATLQGRCCRFCRHMAPLSTKRQESKSARHQRKYVVPHTKEEWPRRGHTRGNWRGKTWSAVDALIGCLNVNRVEGDSEMNVRANNVDGEGGSRRNRTKCLLPRSTGRNWLLNCERIGRYFSGCCQWRSSKESHRSRCVLCCILHYQYHVQHFEQQSLSTITIIGIEGLWYRDCAFQHLASGFPTDLACSAI